MKLHSYWRILCSQRVRIAFNLKGLEYEYKAMNLLKGEQFTLEFERLNPLKYVPVLEDGDVVVVDLFAILLYLEDKYPEHPLLPRDLQKKARNIQMNSFEDIASDLSVDDIKVLDDEDESLRGEQLRNRIALQLWNS